MRKNLFILFLINTIIISGCTNSSSTSTKIDPENRVSNEGFSVEEVFNQEINETQYINDLENFLSYNILSITENKPFSSDFSLYAQFDENSSIQGWVEFSQEKLSKSHDLETSNIKFNIKAEKSENDTEPFDLSGNISLLYKDNEMYANLHDLNIFMGEGNMIAKMYTLLGDLIIDNRVNLEIHSGGIVTINEDEDIKLPYIVGTIKNVLETKNIQDSPNFLGSVAELLDTINSHINLGISTNELTLINQEISYLQLSDKSIQKIFTGSFLGKDSAFDLSFTVSKSGLKVYIYNMKEFDEDIQDYNNTDSEILFSIQENGKSEYYIIFQSTKHHQNTVALQGKIKYLDTVKFSADFTLEPIEIINGQKISGKLNGNIIKKGDFEKEIPELTGNILSLSELLSSL